MNVTASGTATATKETTVDVSHEHFEEADHVHFQFLQHSQLQATGHRNDEYRSVMLNQGSVTVPKAWILLDNQSTVDVFYNKNLLRNIRKAKKPMEIHCNAGVTSTDLIGDLPGYGEVWYDPNGIANILSLARVKDKYRVTFDSGAKNKFIVHKEDGTTRCFEESRRGLYFLETTGGTATVVVNTVADNKTRYTNRDYSRAILARKLQNIIGRPSTRRYLAIIDKNELPNCPVTRNDIVAAEDIFGPNLGSLKGKTVRSTTPHVRAEHINIPISIMERYRDVTIAGDVMFVNRIPFFMSISRHIKFGTAEMITTQKADTLMTAIKHVKSAYLQRGFKITHLLLDRQFELLRGDAAGIGITLNIVSRDEHVPEAERYIRTVKERTRCIYNTLPFPKIPSRMVI